MSEHFDFLRNKMIKENYLYIFSWTHVDTKLIHSSHFKQKINLFMIYFVI